MSSLVVHESASSGVLISANQIRSDQSPALVYLSRLSPGSRRVMRQSLDAVAGLLTGGTMNAIDLPWHEMRYQHTAAVRSALSEKYAPATANRILSAMRAVLKEAWRLGRMSAEDFQRAADLKNVRGDRLPAGRALTRAELLLLFRSCDQDECRPRGIRDAALLAILYGAGVRRAEAAKLALSDYNEEAETLRVRGKGNKERLAPLASGGARRLSAWLEIRGQGPGALLCPVNKGGRVAVRHMSGQAIWGIILRRADMAEVERFSPHDARRTFISDLLDAGADLSIAQQLAGHSSPATTARYDRRGETAKRKAASRIEVPGLTI